MRFIDGIKNRIKEWEDKDTEKAIKDAEKIEEFYKNLVTFILESHVGTIGKKIAKKLVKEN